MPPQPRPAVGIERPGCPYVHLSVRPSVDQVKIFGQGRISRPFNGSNLVFYMRVYLYETSKNIQSHDLMTYISRSTDFGGARGGGIRIPWTHF